MSGSNPSPRRNALVIAYACRPRTGSEPGAGWGMVMALNEFVHPIVITRPDNLPSIEDELAESMGPVPEFIAVDEPIWAPRVRGNRILAFLGYLAWLRRAHKAVVARVAEGGIAVVHHVTYSPYWLPTPIGRVATVPSIWGPVGGAVTAPRALRSYLGRRGRVTEWFDRVVVRLVDRLPRTRRSWREVSLRVVQNRETMSRIHRETQRPAELFNHAVVHTFDADVERRDDEPYAVWLSPLDSRKGPELALRAMARATTDAPLRMVGDGPERERMERLVADLGIEDRVTFLGRVPHEEAIAQVANASAAVFTGLREEGGLALTEALFMGTPTIVLDHGGPAVIARAVTDPSRVALVDVSSERAAVTAIAEAIDRFTSGRSTDSGPLLDRQALVDRLAGMYDEVIVDEEDEVLLPIGHHDLERPLPQVSIIMAALDVEDYIAESITSLLDQSFQDFELIIVENGSTDRTREIIEKFAARDDRIRAFTSHKRMGVVSPIVYGIRHARADLIARCDADDLADPRRIERQVEFLRQHPDAAVVGTNARHIDLDGQHLGLTMAGPASIEAFAAARAAGEITMVLDGTAMFRRSAYDASGGYDPDFTTASEVDLYCRMAEFGAVVALQDPLMSYRLHGASNVDSVFFQGRQVHRFVAYRERQRVAGEPAVPFRRFVADERRAPRRQRLRILMADHARFHYRMAGIDLARKDRLAAAAHVAYAGILDPGFVIGRTWERRWSPKARRTIRTDNGH